MEALNEEVGEKVRAGLVGEHRRDPIGAGEDVVAMKPTKPRYAEACTHDVERSVGSAVGVGDGDGAALRLQRASKPLDLARNEGGTIVQKRRQRANLRIKTPPPDASTHLRSESSASDDDHGPALRRGTATTRRNGR